MGQSIALIGCRAEHVSRKTSFLYFHVPSLAYRSQGGNYYIIKKILAPSTHFASLVVLCNWWRSPQGPVSRVYFHLSSTLGKQASEIEGQMPSYFKSRVTGMFIQDFSWWSLLRTAAMHCRRRCNRLVRPVSSTACSMTVEGLNHQLFHFHQPTVESQKLFSSQK